MQGKIGRQACSYKINQNKIVKWDLSYKEGLV